MLTAQRAQKPSPVLVHFILKVTCEQAPLLLCYEDAASRPRDLKALARAHTAGRCPLPATQSYLSPPPPSEGLLGTHSEMMVHGEGFAAGLHCTTSKLEKAPVQGYYQKKKEVESPREPSLHSAGEASTLYVRACEKFLKMTPPEPARQPATGRNEVSC